jgi:hypothetical protein
MSTYAKQRLLRTLLDLREEASKCDRAADNDRSPESAAAASYRGYSQGIGFAVDEIVAALRIDAEEVWSSEVDMAERDQFAGKEARHG